MAWKVISIICIHYAYIFYILGQGKVGTAYQKTKPEGKLNSNEIKNPFEF